MLHRQQLAVHGHSDHGVAPVEQLDGEPTGPPVDRPADHLIGGGLNPGDFDAFVGALCAAFGHLGRAV